MQKHVLLPVESEYVTGEIFIPSGKVRSTMLFCHGWTGKNTKYLKLAEQLSTQGVLALAINLRGHGDSEYPLERYSRQDHLSDILVSIDYLKQETSTPLILLGKSYGGYLSAIASSQRAIDYLIISQPALYPDRDFNSPNADYVRKYPGVFRSKNEVIISNKALSAISAFTKPLLIVESEHDEEVFDIPKLYREASEGNKNMKSVVVKDTNHSITRPEWLADYYHIINAWLQLQGVVTHSKEIC